MDLVIESFGDDLWAQQQADWAWFRFSSANVLIREESGGGLAPALARGLLEQAAYWDWALATEVGADHLARWATIEYERLDRLATEVGDTTWLGWILPPGTGIASDGADGIPANAADAVNRLGGGLEPAVLAPLQFPGLFRRTGFWTLWLIAISSRRRSWLRAGVPNSPLRWRRRSSTLQPPPRPQLLSLSWIPILRTSNA